MPTNPTTHPLILVTCASGKQATALLPLLTTHSPTLRLRLACHSPASATRLRTLYPHAEVLTPDLTSPSACHALLDSVTACFHIGPSFHPSETAIGLNMIAAAGAHSGANGSGTFKHFVYSSVLYPILRKLSNHDNKRYVEEALVESDLVYTILQPSHLINPAVLKALVSQPGPSTTLLWNFSPHTKFSFLSLPDLAAIALKIITDPAPHAYAVYPLCSTPPQSYLDVVAIIGPIIGKEITVSQRSFEDGVDALMGMLGIDSSREEEKIAVERMILMYKHKGLVGGTGVAEWLLGRKAVGWEGVARRVVREVEGKE